jgi:hypothetical protein
MLLQNGRCVVEQAAHAGKAVPRTIAAESATFALVNIFKSPKRLAQQSGYGDSSKHASATASDQ